VYVSLSYYAAFNPLPAEYTTTCRAVQQLLDQSRPAPAK
jgi:hypothetical protein